MIIGTKPKIYLFAIIVISLILNIMPIQATDPLNDYADRFLASMREDMRIREEFNQDIALRYWNDREWVNNLGKKLPPIISDLENNLLFYQEPLPADATETLKQAVYLRKTGLSAFITGVKDLKIFTANPTQESFDKAFTELENAMPSITGASDVYNQFADERNQLLQTEAREASSKKWQHGILSFFKPSLYIGIPAIAIYVYLTLIGLILYIYYHQKQKALIAGKLLTKKIKKSTFYGVHLLILLPFLYLMLIFCALLVIDFTVGFGLIMVGAGRLIPALVIVVFFILINTLWGIIKGLFSLGKRNDAFGIKLDPEKQPKLFALCEEVASLVGTNKIDQIYLSPTPGLGVQLDGSLFSMIFKRANRVLTIGLPTITNLTIGEMKCILAHEFGHFSNRDTSWNSLTATMSIMAKNTLMQIPHPKQQTSWFSKIVTALNPALWAMYGYWILFCILTGGFSRLREILADKTAISLFGEKNFISSLDRVVRNDIVFEKIVLPRTIHYLHHENKICDNLYAQTESIMNDGLTDEGKDQVQKYIDKNDRPSIFNSHPTLKTRFAYAPHFDDHRSRPTETELFKTLIFDFDQIAIDCTLWYNQYLAKITNYKTPTVTTNETSDK